jgi:hypothetical protein
MNRRSHEVLRWTIDEVFCPKLCLRWKVLPRLKILVWCYSKNAFYAASLPVVMPHLEQHCSDNEEGARTMVAECLGSLTCMVQPAQMLKKLSQMVESHTSSIA